MHNLIYLNYIVNFSPLKKKHALKNVWMMNSLLRTIYLLFVYYLVVFFVLVSNETSFRLKGVTSVNVQTVKKINTKIELI